MKALPEKPVQSICLQHRITQTLFIGRLPSPRIGVIQFASRLRRLYEAIESKDPYAVLLRDQLRQALADARHVLQRLENRHKQALTDCRSLTLHQPFTTDYARTFSLNFRTPEAYQASFMLVDMDYLLGACEHCRRFGIVLPGADPKELRYTAIKLIQRTLQLSFDWKATGITQDQLMENTPQSQAIAQQMDVILTRPLPVQAMGLQSNKKPDIPE